ncbi:MAG: methyltransferase domain-containing protein [Bdellovibrionota bacterium]
MTKEPRKSRPPTKAKPSASPHEPEALEAASGVLLQSAPGLAKLLQKELIYAGAMKKDQKVFVKLQRNHDLVFLNQVKEGLDFEKVRIAEVILRCPAYGRFKISKRQLELIADELKELGPRRLVISVAGKHFKRQDLVRFFWREMEERGYDFNDDLEPEVWIFCVDENWYFGVPLIKSRDTEGRFDREEEREGALPPTIAAALAFAAHPRENDVVLDPVCGSGTLLSEFHRFAPTAKLIGRDIDPQAISIAKRNLKSVAGVDLKAGDSRELDLSVKPNLILANLPFGVQFGSKETNLDLYKAILKSVNETAAESWRGVFLTSDTKNFEAAVDAMKFYGEVLFKVKVRGELATAYRVKAK